MMSHQTHQRGNGCVTSVLVFKTLCLVFPLYIVFLISQFRDCQNPQYTSDQEGAEMKNPNLEIAMNNISIFLGVTSLGYNTL